MPVIMNVAVFPLRPQQQCDGKKNTGKGHEGQKKWRGMRGGGTGAN